MFDWFKKKSKGEDVDDSKKDNVVPLPFKPRIAEPTPAPEKLPQIHYRVGKADDGRVTLQIGDAYGSSILYMNNVGVQNLIKLLEAAMTEELEEEDDE